MPNNTRTPKVFTVRRFAEIIDCHINSVRRMIRQGRLDATNIGNEDNPEYRIPRAEIDKFTEDTDEQ